MAFVGTYPHAKGGRQDSPRTPQQARMAKCSFKFRTDTKGLSVWSKAAKARKQSLSEFARDSMNAAAAGLVTGEDLTRNLQVIRTTLNAAQAVRTDAQRNARIVVALSHINAMLRQQEIPND